MQTTTDRLASAASRLLQTLLQGQEPCRAAEQVAAGAGLSVGELALRLRSTMSTHFLTMTGMSDALPPSAQRPAQPVEEALVLVEGKRPQVMTLRAWLDTHFEEERACAALLATAPGESLEHEGVVITRLGAL